MLENQIKDLLTEKRIVDKEIGEIEEFLNGPVPEKEQRRQYAEAEREQEMKYRHELGLARDTADIILERLKEEEKKSKDMLDLKITAEHNMAIAVDDANDMAKKRAFNR